MAKLNIAYNNAYRIVMNYRRRNSASLMFVNDYVNNVTVKLRKSYYSLYKRIQLSCNSLIFNYMIIILCSHRHCLPCGITHCLYSILNFVS